MYGLSGLKSKNVLILSFFEILGFIDKFLDKNIFEIKYPDKYPSGYSKGFWNKIAINIPIANPKELSNAVYPSSIYFPLAWIMQKNKFEIIVAREIKIKRNI